MTIIKITLAFIYILLCTANSHAASKQNIWIDTDPACNGQPRNDPDDCLALYAIGQNLTLNVIGLTATFGNVSESEAFKNLKTFIEHAKKYQDWPTPIAANFAAKALCEALSIDKITILALGSLTNISTTIKLCPQHIKNIEQIIFVGGRRIGHVFHPAEDKSENATMGHGPIFRDLNVYSDIDAVKTVLNSGVKLVLAPYELARQFEIKRADLNKIKSANPLGMWLASHLNIWMTYWETDIGRKGFYPFDFMAYAVLASPSSFNCTPQKAEVKPDTEIGFFGGPMSLIFEEDTKNANVTICLSITPNASNNIRQLLYNWK